MVKEESEFGKGLTYCLGLFLAHAERIHRELEVYKKCNLEEGKAYEMWFYGAADHLYDFEWQSAPRGLKARCKRFQEKLLSWRLVIGASIPGKKEYDWSIQEAKDLLRLIDKKNGIETIKGSWE